MNGPTFVNRVRLLTKARTEQSLALADIALYADMAKDELVQRINEVNEGYFDVEQKTDLVAGQRQYTLPSWFMSYMQKMMIKFEDWIDYVEAREERISIADGVMSEADIMARNSDSSPKFWLRGNSVYILTASAIPDAVDGIVMWSKQYPGEITETTLNQSFDLSVAPFGDVPGIPREMHHVLALRTSILYKENRDRPIPLSQQEQAYEFHVQKMLDGIVGQNRRRAITAKLPSNDGSQY